MISGQTFRQFLRFGIVGAVATAVDFVVLIILTERLGIQPIASAAISFITSVLVNYVLSMNFVFARRTDIRRQTELAIFILLSAAGLGINEIIMWAGVTLLHANYIVTKLAATAIVLLWNFMSRKIWLEPKES